MYKSTGITLIELLISLSIFGIILAISIPNLSSYFISQEKQLIFNNLKQAVHLARSNAVITKKNTKICSSIDSVHCGGTWNNGFIVKQNNKILKSYPGSKHGNLGIYTACTTPSTANSMLFLPNSYTNIPRTFRYVANNSDNKYCLYINKNGRTREKKL
jgi:prepilin-type N-terminal cleavage/methylation domain-containing protein